MTVTTSPTDVLVSEPTVTTERLLNYARRIGIRDGDAFLPFRAALFATGVGEEFRDGLNSEIENDEVSMGAEYGMRLLDKESNERASFVRSFSGGLPRVARKLEDAIDTNPAFRLAAANWTLRHEALRTWIQELDIPNKPPIDFSGKVALDVFGPLDKSGVTDAMGAAFQSQLHAVQGIVQKIANPSLRDSHIYF